MKFQGFWLNLIKYDEITLRNSACPTLKRERFGNGGMMEVGILDLFTIVPFKCGGGVGGRR